jgi:hypothetical protein
MFENANFIEGCLWIAIGVCFAASMISPKLRGAKLLAAANFVLFGLSDFVEMQTGAWWRPWWLLAWKATCIVVMLYQFVRYARRDPRARKSRRQGASQDASSPDA